MKPETKITTTGQIWSPKINLTGFEKYLREVDGLV